MRAPTNRSTRRLAEPDHLVDQGLQRRQAHAAGDEQQVAVGAGVQAEVAQRRPQAQHVADVGLADERGADRAAVAGLDVQLHGAVGARRVRR